MHASFKHLPGDSKAVILVIDEDLLSLELYSRELSNNYQVIVCEGVDAARRYLKNNPISVVILEPAISGNEGWLLLKEICVLPISLPVIVCSVLDERKNGLEQGAYAFLVKPVLPTTLHHLIDEIVSEMIF